MTNKIRVWLFNCWNKIDSVLSALIIFSLISLAVPSLLDLGSGMLEAKLLYVAGLVNAFFIILCEKTIFPLSLLQDLLLKEGDEVVFYGSIDQKESMATKRQGIICDYPSEGKEVVQIHSFFQKGRSLYISLATAQVATVRSSNIHRIVVA